MFGRRVVLDIEYLEVIAGALDRRVEQLDFAEAGTRYTNRLAELVSALCLTCRSRRCRVGRDWRSARSRTGIGPIRDITLPVLNPRDISGLHILGIDGVARAERQDTSPSSTATAPENPGLTQPAAAGKVRHSAAAPFRPPELK